MRYHWTVCLSLFLLFPFMLAAQDEAEVLIKQMNRAKGNDKIDLLNEISVVYRKTDMYLALNFARQASLLAQKSNYQNGNALSKKNEGVCWFFIGNSDSASFCYREALLAFISIKDISGMSACYNNLGLIAQETGQYDEALRLYQQSVELDRKLGDESGVALTQMNIVDIFVYQGNTKKALLLLDQILKINIKYSNKNEIMRVLINRASIYDNIREYGLAEKDLLEAIKIVEPLNDKYTEATALSNLGFINYHLGRTEDALQLLKRALLIGTETNGVFDIKNTLWMISEIMIGQKQYSEANEVLQTLLNNSESNENVRQQAKVLTSLGRNLISLNEIDKAFGYLERSLDITVTINAPFEKLENYRNLAYAHAIMRNFSTADSLQDLFAETYSFLYKNDSIKPSDSLPTPNSNYNQQSKSTRTDWIIAFSTICLVILLSIIAFRK